MIIDQISTAQEVEECVDLYLSIVDQSWLPASRDTSIKSLMDKVRRQKFVRLIKKDSRIIAWIYADQVALPHADYSLFQQIYYASNQSGSLAYKCVVALHDSMYEAGKLTDAKYCISVGSPFDNDNTFTRILEKNGWIRRGHTATKELPAKTAPAGTQTVQRWRAFAR